MKSLFKPINPPNKGKEPWETELSNSHADVLKIFDAIRKCPKL